MGIPIATRRRARPYLGTLVEIRADCDSEASFIASTDAAFARVANIHRAMSFHEHTSDLQAIVRCRSGECVNVDDDTWKVLQLALQIEHDSEGIFNPAIAPSLVRNGLLPQPVEVGGVPGQSSLARSIRLEELLVVRVLQPVWIDLGGVAKGYAVDAATEALIEHGVTSGAINAGGDLRVFGDVAQQIHLRHPCSPREHIPIATLQELSCATSGDYFVLNQKTNANAVQTAIIGTRAASAQRQASVTVIAPLCAVADALTKVLWLAGIDSEISRAVLRKYEAQAVALDAHGSATYA